MGVAGLLSEEREREDAFRVTDEGVAVVTQDRTTQDLTTQDLNAADRAAFLGILKQTQDLTIATMRPDGWPQATVVSFIHDGPVIYFGCGAGSQKARNIAADARVSLTVTPPYGDWTQIRGLSMAARAVKVTEKGELELVEALMAERFPEAEKISATLDLKPGDMALYRIDPVVISFLDYRKGFGHTELRTVGAPIAA